MSFWSQSAHATGKQLLHRKDESLLQKVHMGEGNGQLPWCWFVACKINACLCMSCLSILLCEIVAVSHICFGFSLLPACDVLSTTLDGFGRSFG